MRSNPFDNDPFYDYLNHSLRIKTQEVDNYRLRKASQNKKFVTLSPSLPLDCPATAFVEGLQRQVDIHLLENEVLPMAETQYGENTVRSAIGAVRHSLIQQFAGMGGKMLGDWECACGAKRFGVYKPCAQNGCQMQYKEIGFRYSYNKRVRMTGKIDGVWIDSDGDMWIIDYKFVNEWKLLSVRKKPDVGYRRQMNRYMVALRKRLKRLVGFKLVYQNSAEPLLSQKNTYIDSVRVSPEELEVMINDLHLELEKRAIGADAAVACMESGMLDKETISLIKRHKTCKDKLFYENNVRTPFYECPLAEQCLGNKLGSALKQHFKAAKEAIDGSV